MHLDEKVAFISTEMSFTDLQILEFDVIEPKLLPIMIKNMPFQGKAFKEWWANRTVPVKRREFYNLIRILCKIPFKERPFMNEAIFFLSLISFGQSLTDKYWFNPETEILIPFMKYTNNFLEDYLLTPKNFEDIDYFTNKFDNTLNKYFIDSRSGHLESVSYLTPSINTNGNIQKYWDIIDNQFFLMKYLYNINELNFNEIVINDYLSKHYGDLSNKIYLFKKNATNFDELAEKEKSFTLVASKCFVEEHTEFIPASEIIFATGKVYEDVYDMYYEGCEMLGIQNPEYPLLVSNEINLNFGIQEERDFSNFGFIRDARSRVFLKPAPLFGNSYYKYILGK